MATVQEQAYDHEDLPATTINMQSQPNISEAPEDAPINLRHTQSADAILTDAATGDPPPPTFEFSVTEEPDIINSEISNKTSEAKVGNDGDAPQLPDATKRGSIGGIILYNHKGQPYIDINRLVYKPKPRKKINIGSDDLIWYWPDYVFLFCNFISVLGSTYLFLVGATAVTWTTSIGSVNGIDENTHFAKAIIKTGLRKADSSTLGLILMGTGFVNVVNVCFGAHAIVVGYQSVLVGHILLGVALTAVKFVLGGIMSAKTARCDEAETTLFQEKFENYISSYATSEPTDSELSRELRVKEMQLDNIQIALSCCGVNSWTDYMNSTIVGSLGPKKNLDDTDLVFPVSCCRPWWVRNIYCAQQAHLWSESGVDSETALKFRQRINQVGCLPTIKEICRKLLFFMGPGLLIAASIHLILVCLEAVSVFFHIRDIHILVQERSKLTKKEGKIDNAEEASDSDPDPEGSVSNASTFGKNSKRSAIDELKANLPQPTEDQINLIKARSDFNTFEARVKRTHIGKWMATARNSIRDTDVQHDHVQPQPSMPSSSGVSLVVPPESPPKVSSVETVETALIDPEPEINSEVPVEPVLNDSEFEEIVEEGIGDLTLEPASLSHHRKQKKSKGKRKLIPVKLNRPHRPVSEERQAATKQILKQAKASRKVQRK